MKKIIILLCIAALGFNLTACAGLSRYIADKKTYEDMFSSSPIEKSMEAGRQMAEPIKKRIDKGETDYNAVPVILTVLLIGGAFLGYQNGYMDGVRLGYNTGNRQLLGTWCAIAYASIGSLIGLGITWIASENAKKAEEEDLYNFKK